MTPEELGTAELKAILGALPELVVLVDEERKIRFVSRTGEAGYHLEEVLGRDVEEFVTPAARAEHTLLLDRVFKDMEPASHLTEITGADGEHEWYEGSMFPIVRDGRVTSVVVATRNVTARRLAEQELTMLRSLLPICAWCKKIQSDEGEWQPLETYLAGTGQRHVTHGICLDCERTTLDKPDLKGT